LASVRALLIPPHEAPPGSIRIAVWFHGAASKRLGQHDIAKDTFRLTDEQRIDWLRLIRNQNVGPRGIMA